MIKLAAVTLTGLDETTDLGRAGALADRHGFVEYGLLLSRSQAGSPGRYPSFDFLVRAAETLNGRSGLAVHVCGRAVGELLAGDAELMDIVQRFDRIQLNFNSKRTPVDADALSRFMDGISRPVITQHNDANAVLTPLVSSGNHRVLFDASGGMGIRAAGWPLPIPGKICGYAGGIGPDTVTQDILDIEATAVDAFWIDMEGSLRREDRFDLDRCEAVLDACASVMSSTAAP